MFVTVCLFVGAALGQQGVPTVPPYPVSWQMNASTIIMPCNESGFTDPQSTVGWGIIDFDWSNAKEMWAKAKPMDCEERLVEQVRRTTDASPGTTVWVYRNGIKALPWYTLVREKVTDPAYAAWFMRFSDAVVANHSVAHVPVCDDNYSPPRCSDLYHDQSQTPGYPHGDGTCAAPGCDVGSVPVGEYLFDFRAANVSIKGQTLAQWYVEEYLFGPTGAGNPNISGFYFDDDWTPAGPSEMERHAAQDMGLDAPALAALVAAYDWVAKTAHTQILRRGKFAWNYFWNAGETPWIDCPDPMVRQASCAADVRELCNASSPKGSMNAKYAVVHTFSPGCHGSTSDIADPYVDIAAFLTVRGPHAWLGHGWSGCSKVYEYPAALNGDFGEPKGLCTETGEGTGVFTREWTKTTVSLDCNTWSASISGTPPPPPTPPPPTPPPTPRPASHPCSDYGGAASLQGYACHSGVCVSDGAAGRGNCGASLAEPALDLSGGCSFESGTAAALAACAAAAAAACDAQSGCGSFALDPSWSAAGGKGAPSAKLFKDSGAGRPSLTANKAWDVWVKEKAKAKAGDGEGGGVVRDGDEE